MPAGWPTRGRHSRRRGRSSNERARPCRSAEAARTAAETERAVALAELELRKAVADRGGPPGRGGPGPAGRRLRRALGRGAGQEQRAVPGPGRHPPQRGTAPRPRATSTSASRPSPSCWTHCRRPWPATSAGSRQMEMERKGAYEGLNEKVAQLHLGHEQLRKETRNLVTALRSPQTRGRWGEMQLRRVAEMAGMLSHCDFDEQVSTQTDDGRLRPDMVVHMPGGGEVVVDAKVPLDGLPRTARRRRRRGPGPLPGQARRASCAPTSTSWARRSTGASSTARPRWWSPSSPGTSSWPRPSRPTRPSRSTPWPTASC